MKRKKCKPKTRGVALLTLVFFLVAASFVLWTLMIGLEGGTPASFLPLLVALVVLAFGYNLLSKEREKVESGLPFEDEFSKKAKQLAGYRAFLVGIWFNLILSWLIEGGMVELLPRHALFSSMIAMTIVFVASWLYSSRSGLQ